MIIDTLENAGRYYDLHPGLPKVFAFLKACRPAGFSAGQQVIDGDRVYAVFSEALGKGREQALLEAHRRYIDIHYTVDGRDEIGWRPVHECSTVAREYHLEKDIVFYSEQPRCFVPVPPGTFVIVFPQDAHAPLAGAGVSRKVVIKMSV
jgi:YhcH/YjgK/YiaL family protein